MIGTSCTCSYSVALARDAFLNAVLAGAYLISIEVDSFA